VSLEKKIFPTLDRFSMEMRLFKQEREEHMRILLHYDKVMLEKASKISV
jgi:hypothetical protein